MCQLRIDSAQNELEISRAIVSVRMCAGPTDLGL